MAKGRAEKRREKRIKEQIRKKKEFINRILLSIGSFILLASIEYLWWVIGVLYGKLTPSLASILTLISFSVWIVFIIWKILSWKIFKKYKISPRIKLLVVGSCVFLIFILGLFPLWKGLNNILTVPQKSLATFPTFVSGNQKVKFSYGNSSFDFTVSELKTSKRAFNFFDTGGYYPFLVYIENNNLYVDLTTTGNGDIPALTVNHNVISGQPGNWDMNYLNGYGEELVNENQLPIIQLIYDNPYHVVINGFITYPNGFAYHNGTTTWFGQLPDTLALKRIFKYPSSEYQGVREVAH